MKYINVLIISIVIITSYSCHSNESSGKEITNKEEYFELKELVIQCKKDFKEKTIDEGKYAQMMEGYGDNYAKSIEAIPPERRYRVAIFCYKEALKYDKKNKGLQNKLEEQEMLFQVVGM